MKGELEEAEWRWICRRALLTEQQTECFFRVNVLGCPAAAVAGDLGMRSHDVRQAAMLAWKKLVEAQWTDEEIRQIVSLLRPVLTDPETPQERAKALLALLPWPVRSNPAHPLFDNFGGRVSLNAAPSFGRREIEGLVSGAIRRRDEVENASSRKREF